MKNKIKAGVVNLGALSLRERHAVENFLRTNVTLQLESTFAYERLYDGFVLGVRTEGQLRKRRALAEHAVEEALFAGWTHHISHVRDRPPAFVQCIPKTATVLRTRARPESISDAARDKVVRQTRDRIVVWLDWLVTHVTKSKTATLGELKMMRDIAKSLRGAAPDKQDTLVEWADISVPPPPRNLFNRLAKR